MTHIDQRLTAIKTILQVAGSPSLPGSGPSSSSSVLPPSVALTDTEESEGHQRPPTPSTDPMASVDIASPPCSPRGGTNDDATAAAAASAAEHLAAFIMMMDGGHAPAMAVDTPEAAEADALAHVARASKVYCHGDLLSCVQTSGLFEDSKEFVDMPMRHDPEVILEVDESAILLLFSYGVNKWLQRILS